MTITPARMDAAAVDYDLIHSAGTPRNIEDLDAVAIADYERRLTLVSAFTIAGEQCHCRDGQYSLDVDPHAAAACLNILGEDIFELMGQDHERYFARVGAYHRIRQTLEGVMPGAHACFTDPWGFDTYSDLHKDDYGSRPRGYITGKSMRAWLDNRSS